MRRILSLLFVAAALVSAQKYTGPQPPKSDLPYIRHAANLIATEPVEANEQKGGTGTLWTIDGPNSPSKTPLALPIFIIKADKLNPASLQMYLLESKEGHRELTAAKKKNAEPIHVQVTRLVGDNLYQLDVYNGLDAGEYALIQEGSTRMFCFQVF